MATSKIPEFTSPHYAAEALINGAPSVNMRLNLGVAVHASSLAEHLSGVVRQKVIVQLIDTHDGDQYFLATREV